MIALDLDLRVACVFSRDPDLRIRVTDVSVEDDRADLLTGADRRVRDVFLAALRDLIVDYEWRTHAVSDKAETTTDGVRHP